MQKPCEPAANLLFNCLREITSLHGDLYKDVVYKELDKLSMYKMPPVYRIFPLQTWIIHYCFLNCKGFKCIIDPLYIYYFYMLESKNYS